MGVGGSAVLVGSAFAIACAGCGVDTAPCCPWATTVTTPFIELGWTLQKYGNLPSSSNVNANVSPVARVGESHSPVSPSWLPDVLVWLTPSLFDHVTRVPTDTVNTSSVKRSMLEATSTSAAGAGVGSGGTGVGTSVSGAASTVGDGDGVAGGTGVVVGAGVGAAATGETAGGSSVSPHAIVPTSTITDAITPIRLS